MTTLPDLTPGTWTIDAAHTVIGFSARHLMVAKTRGSFGEFTGTVTVGDDLAQSSAEITVQMASVDTRNADRDGHLRGADFFDVENHPTMTFRSTSFDGSTLRGDLTIKGITKPIELAVEFGGVAGDPWGNTKAAFEASGEIDRTQWGLTWNAALEAGGVLVSEKIALAIDAEFQKQA
jgi:polyisoprenoid-binding protein YceI